MDLKRKKEFVPLIGDSSDRKFVIDFIFTNYLGPDVKSDNPRCSFLQRLMAGFQPYSLSDLGPSYVSISLLERLYYYLLRNASPEVILDRDMLHLYLKGKLVLHGSDSDFTEDSQQFTSFFALDVHQQIWFPDSFRIVKGVVLIDDPFMSCIKEEDLERFKSLTGLESFKLDMSECLNVQVVELKSSREGDGNCVLNGGFQEGKFQHVYKRKHVDDAPPTPEFPRVVSKKANNVKGDTSKKMCKSDGPSVMPVVSIPKIDDCDEDDFSAILTGTAKKGLIGPSVGAVDIGVNKAAYLFRVSLPGVKRDYSQFSCEIESEGRVHIKGLLTGGRTITKQSRVFEMKYQQLCPPGPFTLSFSLPGPVDPRLFAPNFRSDGIFEGVIIKL